MGKDVILTDLEMEFLEAIGISYKDKFFFCYDQPDHEFRFVEETVESNKDLSGTHHTLYKFVGQDGTILVRRDERTHWYHEPSVIVTMNGMNYTASEYYKDELYLGPKSYMTDEIKKLLKELRSVAVSTYSSNNDYYAELHFAPNGANQAMSVTGMRSSEDEYRSAYICGRFSGLERQINLGSKKIKDDPIELDKDSYADLLTDTIQSEFASKPESRDFFLKFVPLFSRLHDAALRMPAMNEDYDRRRINNELAFISRHFDDLIRKSKNLEEIKRLQEEKKMRLYKKEREADALAKIIEAYPLLNGRQK